MYKVAISVGGRFHAFHLASELFRTGNLSQLLTSYPKSFVRSCGIPPQYVDSLLAKEFIQRVWTRIPFLTNIYNPQVYLCDLFENFATHYLRPSDIFVGWASFSLKPLRKAKLYGARTIIERGSTHIVYQQNILREEYQRFGIQKNPPQNFQKLIDKELAEYSEADYISVPSLFAKKTFRDHGIPDRKIIHVPYGVDLSSFQKNSKSDSVFRIIFAGGICIRKGVHYLLKAYSELNLPNSELWLIGSVDEEIKPFLKKYAGSYRLIGKVPQRELHWYYSQGSVFCILSIEEGLALVQAQAMACGLPVISTPNTGAEDIIRDGQDGFIVSIRDVEAVKEKLCYLYENSERCRMMGESAYNHIASKYSWEKYGDTIRRVYGNIIQNTNADG